MTVEDLARILGSKDLLLSAAESCTGGMIGSTITAMPGASAYFKGSAVTYSNDSKERVLGVSHDTLIDHGAVSPETAGEMAEGVRKLYDSDISVAVTGIAGPDGGTAEKPVGLVYIAVSCTEEVIIRKFLFSGDRKSVRESTVSSAIDMLCKFLEERN